MIKPIVRSIAVHKGRGLPLDAKYHITATWEPTNPEQAAHTGRNTGPSPTTSNTIHTADEASKTDQRSLIHP